MDRRDLQTLSRIRLSEARSLLKSGLYDGSYYLAGYAVECALKSCIAKATMRHDFPDKKIVDKSYTHNLGSLLATAGLDQELRRAEPLVQDNWLIAIQWSEESRYHRSSRERVEELLEAIAGSGGVLKWIKQRW